MTYLVSLPAPQPPAIPAQLTDAKSGQGAVAFSWQQGDVLVLDNLLVQHGRMSFEGSRRILVSLLK